MFICVFVMWIKLKQSWSNPPPDKATTSVLWPRWTRQDQSPATSWTWRTPFSGELVSWSQPAHGRHSSRSFRLEVRLPDCVSNGECVFSGTQAPPPTPLLAHTTLLHLRICGTQGLPTTWVREWLYQVKTQTLSYPGSSQLRPAVREFISEGGSSICIDLIVLYKVLLYLQICQPVLKVHRLWW